MAWAAWRSEASGAPQKAMMASPSNLLTKPPLSMITAVIRSR